MCIICSGESEATKPFRNCCIYGAFTCQSCIEKLTGCPSCLKDVNILEALYIGDTSSVKLLIERGVDVNTKDIFDNTLLKIASQLKLKEIVKLLIKKGADVNNPPVLPSASGNGGKDIVEIFIRNGADLEQRGDQKFTALIAASEGGHKETAKLLTKAGANVNAKDYKGRTALAVAASKNHKEIVKLLIKNGANVNSLDWDRLTPLDVASSKEVKELLIKNGAVARKSSEVEKSQQKEKK